MRGTKSLRSVILICGITAFAFFSAQAARAKIPNLSKEPYVGVCLMEVATGEVLHEENADSPCYPASVIKLVDLLLVMEKIKDGSLKLTDEVKATAEAARMGGSQVWLKEHEAFPVEDLLYALMIASANDVAMALAIHISGNKESFVRLMNDRIKAIGLTDTECHSVHGLPPEEGFKPDITTARDIAKLACHIIQNHPDALKYTSTTERGFRNNTLDMRTHNHLLKSFEGCNGLKTGWYRAAGYSIAASAERNGRTLVAVVLGSVSRQVRDQYASELLIKGFMMPYTPPEPPQAPPKDLAVAPEQETEDIPKSPSSKKVFWWITGGGILAVVFIGLITFRSNRLKHYREFDFRFLK